MLEPDADSLDSSAIDKQPFPTRFRAAIRGAGTETNERPVWHPAAVSGVVAHSAPAWNGLTHTNASSRTAQVWDKACDHECLALRDVRIRVRLGVHAWEHDAPQLLSVDVELYRRRGAFRGTSLADCLDYDRVHDHLTQVWPARGHVELLELLAEDLIGVCLADARVEACRVVIRKPEVYPGSATPEISVWRERAAGAPR